jgi:hypothetical protein
LNDEYSSTLKFLNVNLTGVAGTLKGTPNSSSALFRFTIKARLESGVPLDKSRQDASDPIRGDAMERHHLPTHCVAGICDLVASGDVQQEEKIKTAGRMPAILKYNFLYN